MSTTLEQQREWLGLLEAELARREQQAKAERAAKEHEAERHMEEWATFFEELLAMGERLLAPVPPGWPVPSPEVLQALIDECLRVPDWTHIDPLRNSLNLSVVELVGLVLTRDPAAGIKLHCAFDDYRGEERGSASRG